MKKVLFLILLSPIFFTGVNAQQGVNQFKILKSIPLPGDGGWDYSIVDTVYHRLFVTHETMVQVIDLHTNKLVGTISELNGVHGVTFAFPFNHGFLSNGDANSIIMFDLKTLKVIKEIKSTGEGPDAIIYDPYSRNVYAFNGDSRSATVINAENGKLLTTVDLEGSPEFAVADGKGGLFVNLEKESQLLKLNTTTFAIENKWNLAPGEGPTALALDASNHRLFSACRGNKGMSVINEMNGETLAILPIGQGVDAIRYDANRHLIFVSNKDGSLDIFHQESADKYSRIQVLKTKYHSKTMAFDPKTQLLYLASADFINKKSIKPGSFAILVVGKK